MFHSHDYGRKGICPEFHHQDSKFIHGTGLQFVARHYTISVNCITLPWDKGFRLNGCGRPEVDDDKNKNDNSNNNDDDDDDDDEDEDEDEDEHEDEDDDDDDIMLVTNTKEPQDHVLPRFKHLTSLGCYEPIPLCFATLLL